MKKPETKSESTELSLDDNFAQLIDMKKNENSALKKIINSLSKNSPYNNSNNKQSGSRRAHK